jgi:hypothetical protein
MTNWIEEEQNLAYWIEEIISVLADVFYDDPFQYDQDFLVYDGDYIQGLTSWYGDSIPTTSWVE